MLSASALLALSGCGSSGVESDHDLVGPTTTPPDSDHKSLRL